MALKLISSDDAARQLGVSLEELNRLREQREISGYRDGASWKFKADDIERLRERRADPQGESDSDDFSFSVGSDEDFDFTPTTAPPVAPPAPAAPAPPKAPVAAVAASPPATPDSQELIELPIEDDNYTDEVVLLSDLEFGASGPGTSSTIIGRPGSQTPDESDIRIVTDEDSANISVNESDLALPALEVDPSGSDSNLSLVVDDQFDVSTEADTQLRLTSPKLDGSGLDLANESVSVDTTGSRAGSSDISLADDGLSMDDLVLGGDPSGSSGSGSRGSKAGESGIALSVEDLDDDELVLGGGSDITLGSADSGISLASPSDSGLSLEEPLALRPKKEAAMELSEEVSLAPLDGSSEIGSDDDFLLTPMQDADVAEQDSGSQVIALDSESSLGSDMFGEDACMGDAMFEDAGGAALLEGDFAAASGDPLAGAASASALAAGPATVSRDAPYTVWNVVSLGACALVLALCGILMFDLMRNMWSWDTPYSLNSSLADTILGIIPGMQ